MNDLDELLTITEAAKMLPHSEATLRRMVREHKVSAVKLGQQWFLTPAEVERIRDESGATQ